MSGDHNMNQKITGTLFSAGQVEAIEQEWRDKCQRYIEMHDAVVRDNDRALDLLRRAETEMRYAGWTKYESDNSARNGVYEQIKFFLGDENPPTQFDGAYAQGVMAERQRIVNLLMIQHEAAKGAHNYWHVAANLIQAEVASDT